MIFKQNVLPNYSCVSLNVLESEVFKPKQVVKMRSVRDSSNFKRVDLISMTEN